MVRWMTLMFAALLFLGNDLAAQDKTSGFDSLVNVIEKNSRFRFYYDRKLTSHLSISSIPSGADEETSLKAVLAGTGFNYSIDPNGKIFFTKESRIQTRLSTGKFFEEITFIGSVLLLTFFLFS